MKTLNHSLALAVVISLGACSTAMPSAQSGFLSGYGELKSREAGAAKTKMATAAIDPAQARVGEIKWMVPARADISSDEQSALINVFRDELQAQLARLPAVPAGRPVVLRAAITRVETVSPALNALSTALLVVPLDRGGAAAEIEAVDAETGKQIAAIELGYFAPLSDFFARFSKLAPAEIALRKAAGDFGQVLAPERPIGAATNTMRTTEGVAVPTDFSLSSSSR
jgi:hypothetical protein